MKALYLDKMSDNGENPSNQRQLSKLSVSLYLQALERVSKIKHFDSRLNSCFGRRMLQKPTCIEHKTAMQLVRDNAK